MSRLEKEYIQYYKVQKGQTLGDIADYFCVAERLLIQENGLKTQPQAGRILKIPSEKGNIYRVREGDTKTLLCGTVENYKKKNGTDIIYIGMRVII